MYRILVNHKIKVHAESKNKYQLFMVRFLCDWGHYFHFRLPNFSALQIQNLQAHVLQMSVRGAGTAPMSNSPSTVLQSVSMAPLWDSLDTISLISFPCSFSIFFTSCA